MSRRVSGAKPKPSPASSTSSPGLGLAVWFEPVALALFGMMCVWSFMAPVDAVSVFRGDALVQNLCWLLTACLVAAAHFCDVQQALTTGQQSPARSFGRWAWLIGGCVLMWLVVCTYLAGAENDPRQAWHGFWQVVSLASCYLCARALLVRAEARALATLLIATGAIALGSNGLYQVGVSLPQDRASYAADRVSVLRAMEIEPGSPQQQRFESRLESPEPYATFALTNSLAVVLSAGLVLLIGAAGMLVLDDFHKPGWWLPKWATISILCGAALVVGVCWFLTRSRTAYVAMLIAAVYGCVQVYRARRSVGQTNSAMRSNRLVWWVGGGLCVASLSLGAWLLVRNDRLVLSEAPKSLAFRLEYWQATFEMIREHGWFGVGLGNFQSYYPQYKLEVASEEIADPHNWLFDVAATLSVPVAIALVGWLAWLFQQPWRRPLDQSEPTTAPESAKYTLRALLVGAMGGGVLCGLLLSLLTGTNLGLTFATWGCAAVLASAMWPAIKLLFTRDRGVSGVMLARTSALAMLVCLLASGSWQASGIGVPLAVLLALSSPAACARQELSGVGLLKYRRQALGGVALAGAGLLVFVFQSWLPVTQHWKYMQQATQADSFLTRITSAERAIDADPLDTQAIGWLARGQAILAMSASRTDFEPAAREACEAFDRWLSRDRHRFTNWVQAGDSALELAAAAEEKGLPASDLLEKATQYYAGAVERNPSSARLHGQLAVTAGFVGDWASFEREAAEAVRLSEGTPHLDRKLEAQQLWFPFDALPAQNRSSQSGLVAAEPLLEWVRTQQTDKR